jgi:hypothetical protein
MRPLQLSAQNGTRHRFVCRPVTDVRIGTQKPIGCNRDSITRVPAPMVVASDGSEDDFAIDDNGAFSLEPAPATILFQHNRLSGFDSNPREYRCDKDRYGPSHQSLN